MSDYIDIGSDVKLFKDGLKGFSKESFISYLENNQKDGRLPKSIDPKKAWTKVKSTIEANDKADAKKAKKLVKEAKDKK